MANAGRTFAPGLRQPYGSLETLAAEKGDSLIEGVLSVIAILQQRSVFEAVFETV